MGWPSTSTLVSQTHEVVDSNWSGSPKSHALQKAGATLESTIQQQRVPVAETTDHKNIRPITTMANGRMQTR